MRKLTLFAPKLNNFRLVRKDKQVKQQLEEETSKVELPQSELIKANKTNVLLKKKMDDHYLANQTFQESLAKKTSEIKDHAEVERRVKHLQVLRVEIDIQRAEAIQLFQVADDKQYGNVERCLHALSTHVNHWDWKNFHKNTIFKPGNAKTVYLLSTTP